MTNSKLVPCFNRDLVYVKYSSLLFATRVALHLLHYSELYVPK